MSAAREPGPAYFDLERFIDMFDEALTSNDERVVNALRSLMMMVILTKSETANPMRDRNLGPLRQLYDDVHHINRRLYQMEESLQRDRARLEAEKGEISWNKRGLYEDKYAREAAKQMAQQIDQDLMNRVAKKINSPGLLVPKPEGLLKK